MIVLESEKDREPEEAVSSTETEDVPADADDGDSDSLFLDLPAYSPAKFGLLEAFEQRRGSAFMGPPGDQSSHDRTAGHVRVLIETDIQTFGSGLFDPLSVFLDAVQVGDLAGYIGFPGNPDHLCDRLCLVAAHMGKVEPAQSG